MSRTMRTAHLARRGGKVIFIKGFGGKNGKKIDHLQNESIVFKYILKNSERMWVGVDSAG
jgi:hypothetical protein